MFVQPLFSTGAELRGLGASAAALAFGSALLVSGCRPRSASNQIAMSYEITPQPVRVGPCRVSVKLADRTGSPVSGAQIQIEADMSHPGMAPVFAEMRQLGGGQYIGSLEFTMPGDWALTIRGATADGEKFEKQIRVAGVGAR